MTMKPISEIVEGLMMRLACEGADHGCDALNRSGNPKRADAEAPAKVRESQTEKGSRTDSVKVNNATNILLGSSNLFDDAGMEVPALSGSPHRPKNTV